MAGKTLLVGLAHPDDEVGAAGTILAQKARGDRVVVVWLTRGEMTEAFGPIPESEVARLRMEQGHRAGEILGVESHFLGFRDTRLESTVEAAREVARVIAEVKPDGVLTWGDGWLRGMRHPDHQACGRIFRDAITLARIAKVVAPSPPHREQAPVFTLRDLHSTLPAVVVDVEPYLDTIHELARFYFERIRFGDPDWIDQRLRNAGAPFGLRYAEVFDAWESRPGVVPALLPAEPADEGFIHPDRKAEVTG
ncbi:MAG TPA: PIG-L deacetylase family protein [Longimicrobiaceae bacterium]|nr:PIG-L deacetylase family protein [Longimicrobiaceae bacterium]